MPSGGIPCDNGCEGGTNVGVSQGASVTVSFTSETGAVVLFQVYIGGVDIAIGPVCSVNASSGVCDFQAGDPMVYFVGTTVTHDTVTFQGSYSSPLVS
ncbi:MAG: hypothetical protein WB778_03895 [Thermoplasmata archaeon]